LLQFSGLKRSMANDGMGEGVAAACRVAAQG